MVQIYGVRARARAAPPVENPSCRETDVSYTENSCRIGSAFRFATYSLRPVLLEYLLVGTGRSSTSIRYCTVFMSIENPGKEFLETLPVLASSAAGTQ